MATIRSATLPTTKPKLKLQRREIPPTKELPFRYSSPLPQLPIAKDTTADNSQKSTSPLSPSIAPLSLPLSITPPLSAVYSPLKLDNPVPPLGANSPQKVRRNYSTSQAKKSLADMKNSTSTSTSLSPSTSSLTLPISYLAKEYSKSETANLSAYANTIASPIALSSSTTTATPANYSSVIPTVNTPISTSSTKMAPSTSALPSFTSLNSRSQFISPSTSLSATIPPTVNGIATPAVNNSLTPNSLSLPNISAKITSPLSLPVTTATNTVSPLSPTVSPSSIPSPLSLTLPPNSPSPPQTKPPKFRESQRTPDPKSPNSQRAPSPRPRPEWRSITTLSDL
jgi:trimeric autotransporter adhesin